MQDQYCDSCGNCDNDVVGCVDGEIRCQNCCFEDGFDPFTGEYADSAYDNDRGENG